MRHEEHMWTASELMYLFVDGEANDVQRSTLFSTLANDADLQTEFADVLRIKTAAENERGYAAPPIETAAGLFERAGFAAPLSVTAGAGAVTASGTAAGGWSVLRSIGTPLLSALAGAVITFFLLPDGTSSFGNKTGFIAGNPDRTEILTDVREPRTGDYEHRGAPAGDVARDQFTRELSGTKTDRPASNDEPSPLVGHANALQGQEPTDRNGSVPHNGGSQIDAMSTTDNIDRAGNPADENSADDAPQINTMDDGSRNSGKPNAADAQLLARISIALDPGNPLEALDPVRSSIKGKDKTMLADRSLRHVPDEPEATSPRSVGTRFAIQIRGISAIELFPYRTEPDANGLLDNLAVAAYYSLSSNHSIGIEVGRENHPLYTENLSGSATNPKSDSSNINITTPGGPDISYTGTGTNTTSRIPDNSRYVSLSEEAPTYILQPRSSWIGVSYRYVGDPLARAIPLRPFVQGLIGASDFGPIGKGIIGLSWKPESRVTFGFGVEGTGILYRQGGSWFSSRKLGATYSAQVEF